MVVLLLYFGTVDNWFVYVSGYIKSLQCTVALGGLLLETYVTFIKIVFCCRLLSTTSPRGSTRLGAASSPANPTPSGCGGTVASTRSCTTHASHTSSSSEKIPCSGSSTRHRWNFVSLCGTVANGKVNLSSYMVQYPILRIAQSVLDFTSLSSLTDLFNQTPSQLLWEASSHMLQLMREGCSYTYPPLSIARYSFIQLSELEQCRVKNLAHGFNTTAQDSSPGSLSWGSEVLPLSHCTLLEVTVWQF